MTDPLAVAFANTRHAVRGKEIEGIGTPSELSKWLHEHHLPAHADEPDLQSFLTLRDAIRSLLRATTEKEPLPEPDTATLNNASEQAPRWPTLSGTPESGYTVTEVATANPLAAARGELARDAIALLGGPLRDDLRACQAPGCIQYFVKDHPRREWCSAGCGNRARAARHYTRHKSS
jgi:predicted RNA-binding Zn ribbon-like protein